MTRPYGRSRDVLLLDFQTTPRGFPAVERATSGFNPFADGSSTKCTSIVLDLVDPKGDCRERAERFLPAYFDALRWFESRGILEVNVSSFREHLGLRPVMRLACETGPDCLPIELRRALCRYLTSLPGFRRERHSRQSQATVEAHGYLDMQMTKVFGNLADIFGHVLSTGRTIDMDDVILGGRILLVTLPPWERMMELDDLHSWVVRLLAGSRSDDLRYEHVSPSGTAARLPVVMDRLREDVVASIRERLSGAGTAHVEIAAEPQECAASLVEIRVGTGEEATTIDLVQPAWHPVDAGSSAVPRVASSLRWHSTTSRLFHTRAERRRDLEALARSGDLTRTIEVDELLFASRLSSLPSTDSGKEMARRAFAIVGSYRKIQAAASTGNAEVQPALFRLGEYDRA